MKSFAVIALLPFALAFAAKRQEATPPACAIDCLADVSLNPAPCGGTDFKCLCTEPSIQTKITACVSTSCSAAEIAVAVAFLQTTCAQAGAPVPEVPAALGGASVTSSVAAATSAASSAVGSATSAAASATSSAAGAVESVSKSLAAVLSSATSVIASATSKAATPSSSSGAQPTGVAKAFVAVGMGAVAGVLML